MEFNAAHPEKDEKLVFDHFFSLLYRYKTKTIDPDFVIGGKAPRNMVRGLVEVQLVTRDMAPYDYPYPQLAFRSRTKLATRYYAVPVYKVRLRPWTKEALAFLKTAPRRYEYSVELRRFERDDFNLSRYDLLFDLPDDRTPDTQGWIETEWGTDLALFGLDEDGARVAKPRYHEIPYYAALFASAEGFFDTPTGSLPSVTTVRADSSRSAYAKANFRMGPEVLPWARAAGARMAALRESLGDAPAKYAALVESYKERAPSYVLPRKCPDGFISDYTISRNWDAGTAASKAREHIPDLKADYRKFGACVDTFLSTFDYAPWMNAIAADHVQEGVLAAQAGIADNSRQLMDEANEEKRLNAYVAETSERYASKLRYLYEVIDEDARLDAEMARKSQANAAMLAAIRGAGQTMIRTLQQRNYEQEVAQQRQLALANPSIKRLAVATPATREYLANGGAAIAERDRRLAEEKRKTEQAMAAAEEQARTQAKGAGDAMKAATATGATGATGASKPAAKPAERPKQATAKPAEIEAPARAPVTLYSAVTANSPDEGEGDAKTNLVYEMEGEVIEVHPFYRRRAECKVDTGNVLIVKWTYTGKAEPDFKGYYRDSLNAFQNWVTAKRDAPDDTFAMDRFTAQGRKDAATFCPVYEAKFIDY
ncbi:hypothetical protein MTR62_06480 [Novosphingobium sp. 1949]|uniref:Uncharacterized protein n=1 Tax=Novosphingobium organovorum TaxID=2930092 RepID=A0ABT0BBH2_9SPHN|nr:hypothetical protein [Novosphingobium organovorum]